MTLNYDRLADVLYVTLRQITDDNYNIIQWEQSIALKVQPVSGEVLGATIPGFSKRGTKIQLPPYVRKR